METKKILAWVISWALLLTSAVFATEPATVKTVNITTKNKGQIVRTMTPIKSKKVVKKVAPKKVVKKVK